MKRGFRNSWIAATVLAGALAAAPAFGVPRVYIRVAPPAPITEVRVVAPSPRHVWIPGFHRWDGRVYVWVPGRWELPPRAGVVWVGGHWRHTRRGWFWVEGHWR